jgi:hypothetical protein
MRYSAADMMMTTNVMVVVAEAAVVVVVHPAEVTAVMDSVAVQVPQLAAAELQ